jgi:hypothetical protein
MPVRQGVTKVVKVDYFPMQKLAKMFPSSSSFDISPVISPK